MSKTVTPYVGVWIETKGGLGLSNTESASLLMWECGLKHLPSAYARNDQLSLLMWECGLKRIRGVTVYYGFVSLLMWECGLKQLYRDCSRDRGCHSLCGSVDWNLHNGRISKSHAVTPYVGVWIETKLALCATIVISSLLMWECGLKHKTVASLRAMPCHSLCGSVDWNRKRLTVNVWTVVTPYVGVWIETLGYWTG